jgi:hypothetical protein
MMMVFGQWRTPLDWDRRGSWSWCRLGGQSVVTSGNGGSGGGLVEDGLVGRERGDEGLDGEVVHRAGSGPAAIATVFGTGTGTGGGAALVALAAITPGDPVALGDAAAIASEFVPRSVHRPRRRSPRAPRPADRRRGRPLRRRMSALPPIFLVLERRLGVAGGSLSGPDAARAEDALADATALALAEVSATTGEAWEVNAPAVVHAVILKAARREYENPKGLRSESAGEYGTTVDVPSGAYLTPGERRSDPQSSHRLWRRHSPHAVGVRTPLSPPTAAAYPHRVGRRSGLSDLSRSCLRAPGALAAAPLDRLLSARSGIAPRRPRGSRGRTKSMRHRSI